MDERESDRQVQSRMLPGFIAEGDRLAGEGSLAEAIESYGKVLSGFQHNGHYYEGRCLPLEFYQGAATKLRAAASELAKQRTTKGYLLDESHEYGGDLERGALRLYLTSNQYDQFVDQAFAFATKELRERDINVDLVNLAQQRLDDLKRKREIGTEVYSRRYVNDLTPLLNEELAAFDKLEGFEERLAARLEPLYPKLTDKWLAEETRQHRQLLETDGLVNQMMLQNEGVDSLEEGIKRLRDHPVEVARLKSRANERGEAFVQAGQYDVAAKYFGVAGNEKERARAERRAEQRREDELGDLVRSVEADVNKMQKSEAERDAFEKAAEDMAAEFDLED